jgi:hypothetical protein
MISHPGVESLEANATPPCPLCGSSMKEEDRSNEKGRLYVWYACTHGGCDGQWLSEQSAPRSMLNWEARNRGLITSLTQ